jgi:predicted nucleic acid-binding protein
MIREAETRRMRALYREDAEVAVWWGTDVECASALARLERDESLSLDRATQAFQRLEALSRSWHRVEATEVVREIAKRFLRAHELRASDALQLAAAFIAAEDRPSTLPLVCLDRRLGAAAQREGFPLVT